MSEDFSIEHLYSSRRQSGDLFAVRNNNQCDDFLGSNL